MRRSFGGGGSGMGGGSGGGGGMLRTVRKALRAGVGGAPPEPFSPSANSTTMATSNSRKAKHFNEKQSASANTTLTLSSSTSYGPNNNNGPSAFSSLINLPISADSGAVATAWGSCSSPTCNDDMEWECLDGNEDGRTSVLHEEFVFGTVPSRDEVNYAVSTLQQALEPSSFTRFSMKKHAEDTGKDVEDEDCRTEEFEKIIYPAEPEVDWVESSPTLCNPGMLQPHGSERVYDAFHLLQSEPSVQRMVISLSSDKAVWDAVLNNEVVKELRGSISKAYEQGGSTDKGSDDSNPVKDILSWVFVNVATKIMQLIDKITKLVNEVFQPATEKKGGILDPLEEKLKTSLFLSFVVLLIVVVTRAQSAQS